MLVGRLIHKANKDMTWFVYNGLLAVDVLNTPLIISSLRWLHTRGCVNSTGLALTVLKMIPGTHYATMPKYDLIFKHIFYLNTLPSGNLTFKCPEEAIAVEWEDVLPTNN